ncbi:hypothetical protein [Zavarzinia compransoris]|uniref:hypothetical protein n=1 Tax=Zavarzinia compransoris TaxID=1264899 RepID=UPI0010619F31|nr:hypothetical protein [Zavarzinia compransoris]
MIILGRTPELVKESAKANDCKVSGSIRSFDEYGTVDEQASAVTSLRVDEPGFFAVGFYEY